MDPDDYLEKNISDIVKALNAEDEVGKVLRAHLCIESVINDFLKESLNDYDFLKPIRLDYFSKVYLSLATGLNKDFEKPLLQIGNIRNKLAHQINESLDKDKINNFFKSFSENHKNEIFSTARKSKGLWEESNFNWKELSIDSKFTLLALSLYYLLKIEVREFHGMKKIQELNISAANLLVETET